MKALSLIQPWAWLVTKGPKRIENRSWHLPHAMHGQRVLIHASKTDPKKYGASAQEFMEYMGLDKEVSIPDEGYAQRGGIVGAATLVGCLCPQLDPRLELSRSTGPLRDAVKRMGCEIDLRWWVAGEHGFVLKDVEVLPFEPCPGALGFFDVGPPKPSSQLDLFAGGKAR